MKAKQCIDLLGGGSGGAGGGGGGGGGGGSPWDPVDIPLFK